MAHTKKSSVKHQQAFHYAGPAYVDEILQRGVIAVGMERLVPSIWFSDCPERIRQQMDIVIDDRRQAVDEIAAQALGDLASEMVEALHLWQKSNGVVPTSTKTDFQCFDFLAGDLEFVFLSVGDWIHWGWDEPSGFVFDTETLLRRGATLRTMDLGPRFAAAIRDVLVEPWKDYLKAKDAILTALAQVKQQGELRGRAAIEYLRDLPVWEGERPAEVLWPGNLPVSMATQVWKEGTQLRRTTT